MFKGNIHSPRKYCMKDSVIVTSAASVFLWLWWEKSFVLRLGVGRVLLQVYVLLVRCIASCIPLYKNCQLMVEFDSREHIESLNTAAACLHYNGLILNAEREIL